jgi:NAD(P)H-dependent FMN reductase
MKVLILGASMRRESINNQLAGIVAAKVTEAGHDVESMTMRDVDSPTYDADVENADGMAPAAAKFRDALRAADAFIIVSPEYNFSIPGGLKNVIDWVSRGADQPFMKRPGFLASASPSPIGGNRGLWALRIPLESLGAPVYPRMFSLAQAPSAMSDGKLNEKMDSMLDGLLADFLQSAAPR